MAAYSMTLYALFLGSLVLLTNWLCRRERIALSLPKPTGRAEWIRAIAVAVSFIGLTVAFRWASEHGCLETPEVQPSPPGRGWRLLYHFTLLFFLIWATAIDFDCYVIPDFITVPGTLLGLVGACWIQEAQLTHLWVDWAYEIPQIRGPYIPGWYDTHRFWHAVAWSVTGAVVGAALTFLARAVSSLVLGQEAMGLGDVTLMAMIGSYLGWQATILVFFIAPLTGLVVGLIVHAISGKVYLPYGPWLSAGAVIVLFGWSPIWFRMRTIFSDWVGLLILAAVGSISFVLLLALLRFYKSVRFRNDEPR